MFHRLTVGILGIRAGCKTRRSPARARERALRGRVAFASDLEQVDAPLRSGPLREESLQCLQRCLLLTAQPSLDARVVAWQEHLKVSEKPCVSLARGDVAGECCDGALAEPAQTL